MGQLFRALKMAVCEPSRSHDWFLPLGNVGQSTMAWPLKQVLHSSKAYHHFVPKLDKMDAFEALHCFDPQKWQAVGIKIISPFEQFVQVGGICAELHQPSIHIVADGAPKPVLELAAFACFWDLAFQFLRQLYLFFFGFAAPGHFTVFDLCKALVQGILKLEEKDCIAILMQRSFEVSSASRHLLQLDDGSEILEKDERQMLKNEKRNQREKKYNRKEYFKDFRTCQLFQYITRFFELIITVNKVSYRSYCNMCLSVTVFIIRCSCVGSSCV